MNISNLWQNHFLVLQSCLCRTGPGDQGGHAVCGRKEAVRSLLLEEDKRREAHKRVFRRDGEWKSLRKWEDIPREELENFTQPPVRLDHGYDESKDESLLDIADMRGAAEFRGGKCLSGSMTPGDLDTPLGGGNAMRDMCSGATPRIVLKGRTLVSRLHGPQMGV